VEETLEFSVLLRLIGERSAAFRAAVMSASGLELRVPGCPGWTLLDLVRHLGAVHRFWAAAVEAGPGWRFGGLAAPAQGPVMRGKRIAGTAAELGPHTLESGGGWLGAGVSASRACSRSRTSAGV
jgi:hypothetical protein